MPPKYSVTEVSLFHQTWESNFGPVPQWLLIPELYSYSYTGMVTKVPGLITM